MSEMSQPAVQRTHHILIVDDEPEISRMLSLYFQKNNYHITTAADAAEASTLLALEQFDAVISDIMMPGEDGVAFLGRIHDSWPDLPVVLMTGHAQMQMAVNAIKNGAFDFVCKPFDFDHMRKIVERAVNYSKLQMMEKNYRAELEETVTLRTTELKKSMLELDFARAALQHAASDKSTFMSTISHEMRTPMNGVIGSLELLSEENLTGAAPEYLSMARQSADNMMLLINQLLTFNTLNAHGSGASLHEPVDVQTTLQSIFAEQKPHFTRKGLAFSLQVADDLPHQIWTDRDKMCRLFEILLGNALKFTDKGAVTLEASRTSSETEGELLLCTVTDSGAGIPEGMLERIFEPFVQGDGSHARRYEGVGLGLAIARQNALLLNSHLWAEHVPAGGSRFNVSFKICTP